MKKLFAIVILLAFVFNAQAVDIYATGYYLLQNGNKVAAVYKNNEILYTVNHGGINTIPKTIVCDSNMNVYWMVNTYEGNSFQYTEIWKNDQLYVSTQNLSGVRIFDIYCLNDTLYYIGYQRNEGSILTATVWKGEDFTTYWVLGDGIHSSVIYDADVDKSTNIPYYCGYVNDSIDRASVWRASQLIYRFEPSNPYDGSSKASEISIDNGSVYYRGQLDYVYEDESYPYPTIWKDGVCVYSSIPQSGLSGLYASDGNFYYVFCDRDGVGYYVRRNQSSNTLLLLPYDQGRFERIVGDANDIYVLGTFEDSGTIWKNYEVYLQPNNCSAIYDMVVCYANIGVDEEYIQRPTTINTWDYVSEYNAESPYNKNITLEYDDRGNLSYYYHVINYPNSPYTNTMWFTYDALNRLSFKQTYYQEYNQFGTYLYYYTYDGASNLTECLVKRRDRESMYFTDEFIIDSKDVYQYENGKKTRWEHYNDSTLVLQNYYLYDYSNDNTWCSETKYNANNQPIKKLEYTYSNTQEILTKTVSNWSTETGTWIHASLTEYEYGDGNLIEKRITNWTDGEISQQQRQLYEYNESGNCTRILFQTMVDSVYADQNRALYVYDENNLCTNANAERWNDTTWVLGGFPIGTPLFFNEPNSGLNDLIDMDYCTRAEITEYVTTPNPKYILTPPNLEGEWYYEIQNDDGSVTYQHLYCAGDTVVQGKRPKIIVRSNTQYDKNSHTETTHEYVYEENGVVFWWNKELEEFTTLYNLNAEIGDEWEIKVGTESIIMHIDTVEYYAYNGLHFRMLRLSDENDLFSGDIVCSIGHLTSFFPERLMSRGKNYRVEGLRCYWVDEKLVFKYGEEDCDAIYDKIHFGVEEDGPSTGSGTLTIYPNPANDVLYVETVCTPSLPDPTYRISNLMGQTLLSGHVETFPETSLPTIDVSSLPAGMYFISVGNETVKFVKR